MQFETKMVIEIREKMGMTQEEFAHKIGVGARAVSLWETGKVKKIHRAVRNTLIGLYEEHIGQ